MFIVFSPGRLLLRAAIIAAVGCIFIDGALHHMPPQTKPTATAGFMSVGVLLLLLAAWIAITGLRYIFRSIGIFFGGHR
jgi:hypothetical protein